MKANDVAQFLILRLLEIEASDGLPFTGTRECSIARRSAAPARL